MTHTYTSLQDHPLFEDYLSYRKTLNKKEDIVSKKKYDEIDAKLKQIFNKFSEAESAPKESRGIHLKAIASLLAQFEEDYEDVFDNETSNKWNNFQ